MLEYTPMSASRKCQINRVTRLKDPAVDEWMGFFC